MAQARPTGYVRLFVGPMFASKTSSMLSDVERYRIARRRCIVVKFVDDVRYGAAEHIVTHDGRAHTQLSYKTARCLADIEAELVEYDVIGVDEVQFYPDAVEVIDRLAAMGKIIICAGLDATWQRKPFAHMGELIAMSEEVVKLKAVCITCGDDAAFTRKTGGSTAEVEIGGADIYAPSCRRCM